MALGDLLAGGQAEPGSLVFVPVMQPLEWLKHLFVTGLGDSDAVVLDRKQPGAMLIRTGGDMDGRYGGLAIFDAIANQILQKLRELLSVAKHNGQISVRHARAALQEQPVQVGQRVIHNLVHLDRP